MLKHGQQHPIDLRLVEDALRGDPAACATLIARLECIAPIAQSLNALRASYLSSADLEDVVQDTLIIVWNHLPTYHGEAKFESWVFAYCRHQVMNAIRAKRRVLELRPNEVIDLRSAEHDPAFDPLDRDCIDLCLVTLDPAQAAVIRHKHFDQLTFDEIAARLALSPNTAKTLYYRGLERMRTWFGRRFREGFA